MLNTTAPILGINRHRIYRDGPGIRTLILFYGCPLKCKYCLNKFCHDTPINFSTAKSIEESIRIDDIYFRHGNGGITFGGGEPLLYSDFINDFVSLCNPQWNFSVETSLNVPLDNIKKCSKSVNIFICDMKIFSNEKYMSYTGISNVNVLRNLTWLSDNIDVSRIIVRVPTILGYTDEDDIVDAIEFCASLGISQIDRFEYVLPTKIPQEQIKSLSNGKAICKYLSGIRYNIARNNGLILNQEECHYNGTCQGTCPKCDAELQKITTYINTLDKFKVRIKL